MVDVHKGQVFEATEMDNNAVSEAETGKMTLKKNLSGRV